MEAYILIKTMAGEVENVLGGIKKVKGVKGADPVTGPFDIIAQVEAQNIDELAKVVVTKIRKLKGVIDTITCIKVTL